MTAVKAPDNDMAAVVEAFMGMHQAPCGRGVLDKTFQQVDLTAEAHVITSESSKYSTWHHD